MDLISVIVPIYNADMYLRKCINSIKNQTYCNLEIILVNDGSTDASEKICEEFAEKDERIKVVNQSNQGVVGARKAGINVASGEYIGWVDADDWIEEDYFENLIDLQRKSMADIVAVAHYHDIGEDSTLVKNGIQSGVYQTKQVYGKMICTGEFFEYGITPQLYTKLFKAEILKQTQSDVRSNIIAGDDAAVVYPSIFKAQKICVSDKAGYHYVQHQGSITKTGYANECERVEILIAYLREVFEKYNAEEYVSNQLIVYKNYLLALREIEIFDKGADDILVPFGRIRPSEKVIIYGAGVLGQKIYKYLKSGGYVDVVDWLDKNYETYRKVGFKVNSPEKLAISNIDYDFIIIANITEKVAMIMKDFLLSMDVPEEKIRWFSADFRGK